MISIYNSLTKKKEEFVPLAAPTVNMYTCGVTVYDHCHIGHARSLYTFGVIRHYLEYRGFTVHFVRNITDIDDKIINKALELGVPWDEVTRRYIASYKSDMERLGLTEADCEPKATDNIKEMIAHIEGLIAKGFAYPAAGDVYFNVRAFAGYGKLSGQSIESMVHGVRIDQAEAKKDPLDFALWKQAKPGEPSWPSPWGAGRPGWHIECSAMSLKYLKTQTLDIHAGGRDLIFPHHENEIAQAEALTGKPFARYWIHHGLLTINAQKMSKSLGNYVTITSFLDKYKNPDLLKLFFLSAHYSHPIDYTEAKIEEARSALERIAILLNKMGSQVKKAKTESAEKALPEIEEIRKKFIAAMDDDFNTPQALAVVFELINRTNKHIDEPGFVAQAQALLKELLGVLGLSGLAAGERPAAGSAQEASLSDDLINARLAERETARKNKDYALSDKIRKELEALGVILEDTKQGTTWRRKI